MAFKVTGKGVDDRGRRYVDLQVVGATAAGAASEAAADAAIAQIPFKGARQILVTPTGFHGAVKRDKASAKAAMSAANVKTALTAAAQVDTQGVRVVGV